MNRKTVIGTVGASLAAATVFIGTVAVGVSAQTPPTTPTSPAAQTTPAAKSTTVPGENPKSGMHFPGGHHGKGMKGFAFGFGDFGGLGHGGFVPDADTATKLITHATEFLTLARTDLTYATGKMDTANVQKWLDSADTLLKNAQTAVTDTKYERAGQTTQAAMSLIMTAQSHMAYTLGADTLPSAAQRPMGRHGNKMLGPGMSDVTITQAQASRILAQTYNNLVAQGALIEATDATAHLTDAQAAYKTAYDAYNAGKFNDAAFAARQAGQLAGVARHVQAAADAPDSPDTAVPVPGPTF